MITVPSRLEALLRRDLGAIEVALVGPDDDRVDETLAVRVDLSRGWSLLVTFGDESEDLAVLQRRLTVVVESFRETLEGAIERSPRASAGERLHAELRALAASADAVDAAVIDAQSTVVWGAAEAEDAGPHGGETLAEVIPFDRQARESARASSPPPAAPIDLAIAKVRELPAVAQLARGGAPFAHHDREGAPPLVARSFASIYLLVLVFEAPYDELRVERAMQARLRVIERLILTLPPVDPSPLGARVRRSF